LRERLRERLRESERVYHIYTVAVSHGRVV